MNKLSNAGLARLGHRQINFKGNNNEEKVNSNDPVLQKTAAVGAGAVAVSGILIKGKNVANGAKSSFRGLNSNFLSGLAKGFEHIPAKITNPKMAKAVKTGLTGILRTAEFGAVTTLALTGLTVLSSALSGKGIKIPKWQ